MMPGTALVLSGGGARGAYQAGVLQGLLEHELVPPGPLPFPILVGGSAGALNAATLAAHAGRFEEGVGELASVWGNIRPAQVFRTDLSGLLGNALGWIRDLALGGLLGKVGPRSLLDTAPLARLLARIPFERIPEHVEAGRLSALVIGAINYATGNGVLFLEGRPDLPLWERPRHRVERTAVGVKHLMASSAIPLFFPAVSIDGRPFGDGCIRNSSPLSPAIQLGAQRVLSIGVRQTIPRAESSPTPLPTLAQVAGVLLDALMLDALESDAEHCVRINSAVRSGLSEPFRAVEVLCINPSQSLSQLAAELRHRVPFMVRYLLDGLGDRQTSAELTSYLLFDSAFTGRLLELGREDVRARKDELREFLGQGKCPVPSTAPVTSDEGGVSAA